MSQKKTASVLILTGFERATALHSADDLSSAMITVSNIDIPVSVDKFPLINFQHLMPRVSAFRPRYLAYP